MGTVFSDRSVRRIEEMMPQGDRPKMAASKRRALLVPRPRRNASSRPAMFVSVGRTRSGSVLEVREAERAEGGATDPARRGRVARKQYAAVAALALIVACSEEPPTTGEPMPDSGGLVLCDEANPCP